MCFDIFYIFLSRTQTEGWMDGPTDTTKPVVAFRIFAKAPKCKYFSFIGLEISKFGKHRQSNVSVKIIIFC